jgi:hypothetical protein
MSAVVQFAAMKQESGRKELAIIVSSIFKS